MKKKLVFILIPLIVLFFLWFAFNTVFYTPNVKLSKDKIYIDVPENTDFKGLTKILKPYLKSQKTFEIACKIKRFKKVKPGRYELKNKWNNNRLINLLRIGKQVEVNLTFNNQNSLEDLAGVVSKYISADSVELLKVMKDEKFLDKNGFNENTALLMYLPNTYRFYYNTTATKFRDKMLQEYKKFWTESRIKKAKNQDLTPIEVGILASIVQKESNKKDELSKIAGVYLNRLKKNWLLQADPTVVYAYQQKYGKDLIIKRVLNKHKKVDSPYNTYKYKGLPPGPICMPDIQSTKSVLNPEKHEYYFFVADIKKPGYHTFSKTLKDHINSANSYHSGLNKMGIYH